MRNKSYIETQLQSAHAMTTSLIADLASNKPHVDQLYVTLRLEAVEKGITAALDRLQLEYENS